MKKLNVNLNSTLTPFHIDDKDVILTQILERGYVRANDPETRYFINEISRRARQLWDASVYANQQLATSYATIRSTLERISSTSGWLNDGSTYTGIIILTDNSDHLTMEFTLPEDVVCNGKANGYHIELLDVSAIETNISDLICAKFKEDQNIHYTTIVTLTTELLNLVGSTQYRFSLYQK